MFMRSTCILLLSLTLSVGHLRALEQHKRRIDKCCAEGKIISIGKNFTCVPQGITTELHGMRNKRNGTEFHDCFENGNVTNLSDIMNKNIATINASSACIDFLHDEVEFGVIPIIVHCRENNNDSDSSLEIPKIARFRVCCRRNEIYDIQSRDCIPKQFGELDTADYISKIINGNSLAEFTSFERGPPQCKHAIVNYVIDSKRDLKILRNGTIRVLIPSDDDRSVLLTDENSCLDGENLSEFITVRLCTGPEYCQTNPCVRKCCPEGQMRIDQECQMIVADMPPGEFHRELEKFALEPGNSTSIWKPFDAANYGLIVGIMPCDGGMYGLQPNDSRAIDYRGYIHAYGVTHEEYNHNQYCLEFVGSRFGYEDGFYPAVCFPPKEPGLLSFRFGINGALQLTSCTFLLITFLVYLFLPVLQNLHGKTLMCHVASLFLAYACLAANGLIEIFDTKTEPISKNLRCKFVAYTMLFSFFAAFSWLNVMCFDIWWTFGGLGRTTSIGGRRQTQRKRFFLYSLYAWGLAFILTSLSAIVDYTEFIEEHLRPNIGTAKCWFKQSSENHGGSIFFIGPISLQLVANVVFFILTSLYCSRVKAEITRVMIPANDPRNRRFHSAKSKFILNIKLFIVMGISWIMEIISTFLNSYADNLHWRFEFFYISDVVNCLQGLLIFILFVLKSKVYHALKLRLSNSKANTPGNLTTTLQDPYRVRKSASCSTLMSNFAVNVAP